MRLRMSRLFLWVAVVSPALAVGPGGGMNSGMNNPMSSSHSEKRAVSDNVFDTPTNASYDPKSVTEIFAKTANGGVLHVTAIESSDAKQIGLIRSVLKQRADDFSGQYNKSVNQSAGPSKPGLATLLAAAPGDLQLTYLEMRGGGDLRFASALPELVHAVHQWFDAQ